MANRELSAVIKRNREAWKGLNKITRTLEANANSLHSYTSSVNGRKSFISYKQALTLGPKIQAVQDELSRLNYAYQNIAKLLASTSSGADTFRVI